MVTAVAGVVFVVLPTGGRHVGDDFTQKSADRIQIDVLATALGTVRFEKFA